jgi:hypothetical protein
VTLKAHRKSESPHVSNFVEQLNGFLDKSDLDQLVGLYLTSEVWNPPLDPGNGLGVWKTALESGNGRRF